MDFLIRNLLKIIDQFKVKNQDMCCALLTCAHWFAGGAPLPVAALEGGAAHQGEAGVAGEGAGPGGRVPSTLHLAIGQTRHLALR